MTGSTRDVRTALEKWALDLDPRLLDGRDAERLLALVARMEAICASVKARLARRVEETDVWRRSGHKSAAHHLASASGTSIHQAVGILETAARLEDLSHTAEAFRTGRVSQAQVHEIASAAVDAPEYENDLLLCAGERNHARLREQSARIRAAARGDALERHCRAHAARCLRTGTDDEGVWHLDARGTLTDGARIMARLRSETDRVFRDARKAGQRESNDAYRFDALVRMAEASGGSRERAKAHVLVNVDAEKLTGAPADAGARCEIQGVGPVPVETARTLMGDALLTILVKKGVDVTTIAHDGTKTMPASVRRAVLARDQECVVDSCSAGATQIHHLEWRSNGGRHSVENCRGVCDFCHDLVHYQGYELDPNGDGTYRLRAPP